MRTNWKRALAVVAASACAAVLTTNSNAQTPCQGSTGPDVIVGDITGPWNYSATGGGTVEALSLGTYSCNMGTTNLGWHANTNQHPVIGGELYRFRVVNGAGQFDQVGISWLKHGFFALSNNLCCSGCQGTDGSELGVRCSDPYTAERNGSQGGLGPRYQVNASTGFFTYPPPHPAGGNTGRLEVLDSDLQSGARYFGNCQYIAPDDSAAGNDNNNCSYREISVSGSSGAWSFGMIGTTQREKPAILAWQTCESGVTVNNVDIPSDGRIMVGFKATDLQNGTFHYEYMVYNQNSHESIRSFALPIPSGTTLTNVEFHDITYRGGDGVGGVNQSGTDWTFTNNGTSVNWAGQTFAQNNNGNAIRWGSAYSFRFDANASPVSGTLSLGGFRTGASAQTTGDVPGGPIAGTPFCSGDGSLGTLCPCFNLGNSGLGCANSVNPDGAGLTGAGSVSPDNVVLTASGELPTALSIILQSDTPNFSGQVFGDGLRCIAGHLYRMYTKNAVGGVVTAPSGGDPSITARSAALGDPIAPGSTRYYQSWYRDPNATFCPAPQGSTFNVTSGFQITW